MKIRYRIVEVTHYNAYGNTSKRWDTEKRYSFWPFWIHVCSTYTTFERACESLMRLVTNLPANTTIKITVKEIP